MGKEYDVKRSEMQEMLLRAGLPFGLNLPVEARGDMVLRMIEEAGITWEPEQEPLPARLEFREIETSQSPGKRPQLIPAGGTGWSSREAAMSGYAAAARRYNAWPRLRENASAGNYCANGEDALRMALLNILDILDA